MELYFYVCMECGSLSWYENSNCNDCYELTKNGKIKYLGDNIKEAISDIYCFCLDCDSDDLERFDLKDYTKEEINKLIKMSEEDRIGWAKKQKIIRGL